MPPPPKAMRPIGPSARARKAYQPPRIARTPYQAHARLTVRLCLGECADEPVLACIVLAQHVPDGLQAANEGRVVVNRRKPLLSAAMSAERRHETHVAPLKVERRGLDDAVDACVAQRGVERGEGNGGGVAFVCLFDENEQPGARRVDEPQPIGNRLEHARTRRGGAKENVHGAWALHLRLHRQRQCSFEAGARADEVLCRCRHQWRGIGQQRHVERDEGRLWRLCRAARDGTAIGAAALAPHKLPRPRGVGAEIVARAVLRDVERAGRRGGGEERRAGRRPATCCPPHGTVRAMCGLAKRTAELRGTHMC
jgi:hypothetical protein